MAARKFPELLKPGEVAAVFGVDPATVARWARAGKLRAFHTPGPGGHRRYFRAEVDALLAGKPLTAAQLDALARGDL